eukprot:TRINITY_DN5206_c0_g1_i1.p1 TRINITY_DN5206_c0_g1~~TRINITY_DN5206_c0_g1_i1.p1  ORF type:complete len:340 (+),score=71.37 TRINITY_DN5206_c0_g1_i1:78-1022(+)
MNLNRLVHNVPSQISLRGWKTSNSSLSSPNGTFVRTFLSSSALRMPLFKNHKKNADLFDVYYKPEEGSEYFALARQKKNWKEEYLQRRQADEEFLKQYGKDLLKYRDRFDDEYQPADANQALLTAPEANDAAAPAAPVPPKVESEPVDNLRLTKRQLREDAKKQRAFAYQMKINPEQTLKMKAIADKQKAKDPKQKRALLLKQQAEEARVAKRAAIREERKRFLEGRKLEKLNGQPTNASANTATTLSSEQIARKQRREDRRVAFNAEHTQNQEGTPQSVDPRPITGATSPVPLSGPNAPISPDRLEKHLSKSP